MPMTKIEEFVFGARNILHFVSSLVFKDGVITVTITPRESHLRSSLGDTTAKFMNAVKVSEWKDPEEFGEYPLDIIGFDCYPRGERWQFVLNCDTLEWCWESEWPVLLKKP